MDTQKKYSEQSAEFAMVPDLYSKLLLLPLPGEMLLYEKEPRGGK